MNKSRLVKLAGMGLAIVVVGVVLGGILPWKAEVPWMGEGAGIALAEPLLAQTEEASFLEEEAGIAAYVNYEQQINLNRAKEKFRTIERETDTYIVGSVALPGYTEAEDAHVFVHVDGWFVSYYTRHEPASKIVDWARYSPPDVGTKLALALSILTGHLDLEPKDASYYAFNYPDANRLILIADKNVFYLTIPSALTIYQRALSFSRASGTESKYCTLAPAELSLDVRHLVDIETASGNWPPYPSHARINGERKLSLSASTLIDGVAIALVYKEP